MSSPTTSTVSYDVDRAMLDRARAELLAASTSWVDPTFLQERLNIGYNRAAQLLADLEVDGTVGAETLQGRKVFRTADPELTVCDRDAIAAMPEGWFTPRDLPYPRVTRAEYRCDRLMGLGVLERRITGSVPRVRSEYRLKATSDNKGTVVNSAEDTTPGCVCHACIRELDLRGNSGDPVFDALPLSATTMIVCPVCGNKRCPKASDHRNNCTGSNEPGQKGSLYR